MLKVSYLAMDVAAVPIDLKVSWLCFGGPVQPTAAWPAADSFNYLGHLRLPVYVGDPTIGRLAQQILKTRT